MKVKPYLENAATMWNYLNTEFAGANKQRRSARINALIASTINPKDIINGVQKIAGIIAELTEANGKDELSIQALGITTILNALPLEMAYLKADLENAKPEPKLIEIITRISTEVAIIKNNMPYTPSYKNNNIVSQANANIANRTENPVCKHCGETGHYSAKWANCPKHDPSYVHPNKRPRSENEKKTKRVGASVINNKLIPTFDSNLDDAFSDVRRFAGKAEQPKDKNDLRYLINNEQLKDKNDLRYLINNIKGIDREDIYIKNHNSSEIGDYDEYADREAYSPTYNRFAGAAREQERPRTSPHSNKSSQESDDDVKLALIADYYEARQGVRMVVDSGASPSYVYNKDTLTDISYKINDVSTAERGQSLTTIGEGNLKLPGFTLPNVNICPTMGMNLISVSSICDLGFSVIFTKSKCTVNQNNVTILTAQRSGGLYIFYVNNNEHDYHALQATRTPDAQTNLWHHRLGHLYYQGLITLAPMVTGMDQCTRPRLPCEDCVKTKITRRQFPASQSRASRKGELIHSDIVELEVRSTYGDFKYFVTFIDDFSGYITVIMLQKKSDTYEAFVNYDAKLFNQTQRHISILRSDGKSNPKGTEYHSSKMQAYCNKHGISQQSSCAHTPEENSRAERQNRTIVEGANTMLQYARMPKVMWNFAVLIKVYLMNRSPHKAFKNTPYERYTGKIPNLAHLRVFGTACMIHVPKVNRQKLDAHATEALFVGYSDHMKAWTFWDYRKGNLITSSSAVFGNEIFELEDRHKINIAAGEEWTENQESSGSESDEGFTLPYRQPFTIPSTVRTTSIVKKKKKVRFEDCEQSHVNQTSHETDNLQLNDDTSRTDEDHISLDNSTNKEYGQELNSNPSMQIDQIETVSNPGITRVKRKTKHSFTFSEY
jgi:hypothetical protein